MMKNLFTIIIGAFSTFLSLFASAQSSCSSPEWKSSTAYTSEQKVVYQNKSYQANYWTQNQPPSLHSAQSWDPWKLIETCGNLNISPRASFQNLSSGQTLNLTPSEAFIIKVNAADSDGSVSEVRLNINGQVHLMTLKGAYYEYSWVPSTLHNNAHSLSVHSIDNLGASSTHHQIQVSVTIRNVNRAPVASIISPANNASFTIPESVTIEASASDSDGSVSKVEFYNGDVKIGEDLSSPYSLVWSNVAAGTYTISVKATDNNNETGLSVGITIVVKNKNSNQTEIKGLTVLVEYLDAKFNQSEDSVAMLFNQTGFKGWGNDGSVKDFFYTQTDGKVLLTSVVIKVSLSRYVDEHYGIDGNGDIADIAAAIRQKYPNGFQDLTLYPDNSVVHFCVLNKANKNAWAFNKQPGDLRIKNNGKDVVINEGNISTFQVWQKPEVNVICHETGHSLMGWADHYNTAWSNLGNYCAMASAGSSISPMQINPALRLHKGWIDNVIEIGNTTQTYTAVSNSYNTIYKYTNPSNPKEYLLVHPQVHGKYYLPVLNGRETAQGLAIYYVDEDGGMDLPGDEMNYLIKLVQADNKDEMHTELNPDVRGDLEDLYDNNRNSFPNGHPFRWKDGGEFGLFLSNISAPGNTMSFKVNARPSTFIATSDKNGTIVPAGVISANNNELRSFIFNPFPGYEIDQVKVNGTVTSVTGNSLNVTASGTKSIVVSYKRKTTLAPLPSPWQHADIGQPSISGVSGTTSNTFYLETYGGDIWGNYDNFRFVYQTMTGDGTIEGKLSFSNKPHRWSKAGLMIRESLQHNSAYSMIMYTPRNHTRVQQRIYTGSYADDIDPGSSPHIYNLFKWFRITRVGDIVTSYCSFDKITWQVMNTQYIPMTSQVYVGMAVSGALDNYPSRALFDDVTVKQFCNLSGAKITGTVIGSTGSWNNSGNTREKAFDGNVNSYFDAPQGIAWTGLSIFDSYKVTGVKFYPREGLASRMIGGKFQGSNTLDFSSGVVDLATITEEPAYGWNCSLITNASSFKYLRYICPAGGFGNVAEIEFFGTKVDGSSRVISEQGIESKKKSVAYPNPFADQTTILIPETSGEVDIVVFNSTGTRITSQKAHKSIALGSYLKKGLYYIKIISPSKTETLKLIKN